MVMIFSFVPDFALAQNLGDWKNMLDDTAGSNGAGYDTEVDSVEPMIATIIRFALSFLGVIFLVLAIYGGFLWMTARGNESQIEKAKSLLTAAIVGMIIVVASYALSAFVIENLTKSTLDF
ncbi:hypothetical protein C0583_05830 [Candidatus Parcubacteria bacterium]|nr:MAG: hypothetical protein C0583_05830 [Candidatus Parcubacteria bacterium]